MGGRNRIPITHSCWLRLLRQTAPPDPLNATSIWQVGYESACAPLAQLFFLDLESADYFFVGGLGEVRVALGAGGLFLFLEVRLRH